MASGRSLHDWQSDHSMDNHKQAKPYQEHEQMMNVSKAKPYQKPHQKQQQFPKPYQKGKKWVQDELPFNDKPWRERSLTDTEVEELFWRKLVQLGWRLQSYGDVATRYNIVLPCPYCNLVMDSHTIITESSAKRMQDKVYCDQVLKRHKGLECKAVSEDEPEA
jgi:hypothetical protein